MARRMSYTVPPDQGAPPMSEAEHIARSIQAILVKKDWQQSDLMRMMEKQNPKADLGAIKSRLSAYVNGKNRPRQEYLEKIARALDVSPVELVGSNSRSWIGLHPRPTNGEIATVQQAAAEAMSFRIEGDRVKLAINTHVPKALGLKIMALLTEAEAAS